MLQHCVVGSAVCVCVCVALFEVAAEVSAEVHLGMQLRALCTAHRIGEGSRSQHGMAFETGRLCRHRHRPPPDAFAALFTAWLAYALVRSLSAIRSMTRSRDKGGRPSRGRRRSSRSTTASTTRRERPAHMRRC